MVTVPATLSSGVPPTGSAPGLVVSQLERVVRGLFSAGLATSTQRAYRTGSNRYLKFCQGASITPFPASEQSLCLFVGHLFEAKLTSQTVKSYLAAVRYTQIALGLGDPRVESMPRLEYVIRGVKKSATKKAVARLPITPQILRNLKSVWERMPCQQDALMLWAASCLCFFGFLRAGEIVIQSDAGYDESSHLSYGDVRVNDTSNTRYLEIHLKASKTDPFR